MSEYLRCMLSLTLTATCRAIFIASVIKKNVQLIMLRIHLTRSNGLDYRVVKLLDCKSPRLNFDVVVIFGSHWLTHVIFSNCTKPLIGQS
jgi:hypothetical protein